MSWQDHKRMPIGKVETVLLKSERHPVSDTKQCECQGWARVQPMDYMTKHHPNCKHYNDSIMDAWQVEFQGIKSVVEHEQDAIDTAGGDPECAITKIRIHRECFDQLPDFEGF